MAKLLCIAHGPMFGRPEYEWKIEFGNEYESICEINFSDGKYYELSHHRGVAYAAEHFAELPSNEEIEQAEDAQVAHMDKTLMALAETADEPMPQDSFDRVWKNIQAAL